MSCRPLRPVAATSDLRIFLSAVDGLRDHSIGLIVAPAGAVKVFLGATENLSRESRVGPEGDGLGKGPHALKRSALGA